MYFAPPVHHRGPLKRLYQRPVLHHATAADSRRYAYRYSQPARTPVSFTSRDPSQTTRRIRQHHRSGHSRWQQAIQQWNRANKQLKNLLEQADELTARRKDLLTFQVQELQQLGLDNNELDNLEKEQQTLANADQILQDSHSLLAVCDQDESFNIREGLNRALTILSGLKHKPEALANAEELLQSSMIQVEEAIHEIEQSYRSF